MLSLRQVLCQLQWWCGVGEAWDRQIDTADGRYRYEDNRPQSSECDIDMLPQGQREPH